MTTHKRQSMMKSSPSVATMILALLRLVLAILRWRENGWGAMMQARFGATWDVYCGRAGRLFPRRAS